MFVPHHTLLAAEGASPRCWMLLLHGVYGRGSNWRTFARELVQRRPDWGAVLVDLRMHGQSQAAPGPHTVAAAAADLGALVAALAAQDRPVRAVLGHSFGGKVAMVYRGDGAELLHTWIIDASPSASPGALDAPDNTVVKFLRLLQALPARFASRDAFIERMTAAGVAPALAQWMAMNLERRDDGYVLCLDPAALEELLRDYYRQDSWPALERGPGRVCVVVAGQSSALSAADRERVAGLAARSPAVEVVTIERSGHWVHVDAFDELVELVARGLDRC